MLRHVRPSIPTILRPPTPQIRLFTVSLLHNAKPLPPRIVIPDTDIEESFLKGSGPGGQKINKTSSAVQLKHLPSGIVVKCQETRSRAQNRKLARRLLSDRIEEVELGDEARTKVKEREESRKKRSGEKKRRRKYRALAEGKGKEEGKEVMAGESAQGEFVGSDTSQSSAGTDSGGGSQTESSKSKI